MYALRDGLRLGRMEGIQRGLEVWCALKKNWVASPREELALVRLFVCVATGCFLVLLLQQVRRLS